MFSGDALREIVQVSSKIEWISALKFNTTKSSVLNLVKDKKISCSHSNLSTPTNVHGVRIGRGEKIFLFFPRGKSVIFLHGIPKIPNLEKILEIFYRFQGF